MDDLLKAIGAFVTSHILLHAALLTPPSVLSHARLAAVFLPLIWSCNTYSWSFGLGYIASIHALWAAELLLFRDPRKDFALLHFGSYSPLPPLPAIAIVEEKKDDSEEEIVTIAAVEDKPTLEDQEVNKDRPTEKVTTNGSHRIAWTEVYPESWWKRFVWVSKLVISLRYIGWATSDTQIILYSSQPPPPSSKPRTTFVIQKILVIALCICIMDVTNLYQYFDPYMQIETPIDEAFPRRLGGFFAKYHLDFFSPRFIRIAVLGLQQYSLFTLVGAIPAALFVTVGGVGLVDDFWGRVENWPSLMGSPIAIAQKGLRGFWGIFWHQLFRNILTGPGKALSRALELPPKSTTAYAIQIIIAFGLSGALQSNTLPRNMSNISPLRYASFFWIHGACVLYEIIVVRAAAMLGLNGPRPLWASTALAFARVAWTGIVLYHTLPVIQDELTRISRIFGLRTIYLLSLPE
ncbi:hypothetical protein BKA65DRAFT_599769 [Rhexocercosporidium sp. MPI-PUGE-AT-0058]|nr:hypothetical protein BKA65DRAFT_599769 [Rhexocercosporidium sp. MPI-PUGE-AT-0058]